MGKFDKYKSLNESASSMSKARINTLKLNIDDCYSLDNYEAGNLEARNASYSARKKIIKSSKEFDGETLKMALGEEYYSRMKKILSAGMYDKLNENYVSPVIIQDKINSYLPDSNSMLVSNYIVAVMDIVDIIVEETGGDYETIAKMVLDSKSGALNESVQYAIDDMYAKHSDKTGGTSVDIINSIIEETGESYEDVADKVMLFGISDEKGVGLSESKLDDALDGSLEIGEYITVKGKKLMYDDSDGDSFWGSDANEVFWKVSRSDDGVITVQKAEELNESSASSNLLSSVTKRMDKALNSDRYSDLVDMWNHAVDQNPSIEAELEEYYGGKVLELYGDKLNESNLFENKDVMDKSDLARILTINSVAGRVFKESSISNDVMDKFNAGWSAIKDKSPSFDPFGDDVDMDGIEVFDEFIDLISSLSDIDKSVTLFESRNSAGTRKYLIDSRIKSLKASLKSLHEQVVVCEPSTLFSLNEKINVVKNKLLKLDK